MSWASACKEVLWDIRMHKRSHNTANTVYSPCNTSACLLETQRSHPLHHWRYQLACQRFLDQTQRDRCSWYDIVTKRTRTFPRTTNRNDTVVSTVLDGVIQTTEVDYKLTQCHASSPKQPRNTGNADLPPIDTCPFENCPHTQSHATQSARMLHIPSLYPNLSWVQSIISPSPRLDSNWACASRISPSQNHFEYILSYQCRLLCVSSSRWAIKISMK